MHTSLRKWIPGIRFFSVTAGTLILGFIAGSWFLAGRLIAPTPSQVTWPAQLGTAPGKISFAATDGVNLKGWYMPQAGSTRAVVLLHGVSANRVSMLPRALWLHQLGYNVLLYDARGCGESTPVDRSFGYEETRDLLGALRWLQAQGMTQIGCIGTSQGAATILLASGQLPDAVHAVVAEESYLTLRNTVDDHFRAHTGLPGGYFGLLTIPMAEWKLGFNMDDVSPLRQVSKLKAPVYFIAGASDTLAPPAGVRELYAATSAEKDLWMVPKTGHADFFSHAETEYKQRIGDFLRKELGP